MIQCQQAGGHEVIMFALVCLIYFSTAVKYADWENKNAQRMALTQ